MDLFAESMNAAPRTNQLTERYRPTSWEQVVGQDATVQRIRNLAKRGLAGRAYWLSGPSGAGKTTIGRLLAADVASEWDTDEVDGTTLTVAALKDMERTLALHGMGGKGRAIIVNEAHGLRADVIRFLLVALERIPSHACWVFTTTDAGQLSLFDGIDADPLLSRCVRLPLAKDTCEPYSERARTVAVTEGIDGQPLDDYRLLYRECKGNLRAMLQRVEVGDIPRAAVKAAPTTPRFANGLELKRYLEAGGKL